MIPAIYTHVATLALALIAYMPLPAHASGFYLPPLAEALLFLLITPEGWVALAVAAVLVLACIVAFIRRKRGGR